MTLRNHSTRSLLAILVLLFIAAFPSIGLAAVDYATVTGYAGGTSDNNHADTWGDDCFKVEGDGFTFVLDADYALVIVKAGSEQSAPGHVNTLFEDASEGQTVWADTNGNGQFDAEKVGDLPADKTISHIILCPAEETSSTPPSNPPSTPPSNPPSAPPSESTPPSTPPSETPSERPTPPVTGETPATTLPPTDTAAAAGVEASDSSYLVAIGLLVLVLGVVFMLPRFRRN